MPVPDPNRSSGTLAWHVTLIVLRRGMTKMAWGALTVSVGHAAVMVWQ